jgi:mannose-6-phosphate isomerase-like protein (cupin superfamily)
MRLLILGVDSHGRSCVVEQREDVGFNAIPGIEGAAIARLLGTSESPPKCGEPGEGAKAGDNPAAGLISWYVVNHEPHGPGRKETAATQLHYRNVLELIYFIDGGGDMILGDGPHPVRAGDCVVMGGTSHGLRPGPQGCRLMVFAIGGAPKA